MSYKTAYQEVPFLVKVKSPRGLKNALNLISIMMDNHNVMRNPGYQIKDNIFELLVLKELIKTSTEAEDIQLIKTENPSKQSRQLLRARERRIILSKNDKRLILNKRRYSLKKSKNY